ncbi:DUF1615 domain-containing protein [Niveibacterium sp. SC-1]|uniref:DUF1615 domain-containing protein n=1 Tax=Niveibacterium sp. SC-1 TaxID=3135646 RepID=UPI00311EB0D4
MNLRRISLVLGSLILSACASSGLQAPVETPAPPTAAASEPAATPGAPAAEVPPVAPAQSGAGVPSTTPTRAPQLDRQGLTRLIPENVKDRAGWGNDIYTALASLRMPATVENACAAMAVIEQESTWQGDPVVPGLPQMVWQQMYAKAARYGVPQFAVDVAMLKPSPDGRTYKKRIDALRTEREMNAVYEDMVSELPDAAKALGGKNPIRTGGPMQVSVAFAEDLVKTRGYPYASRDTVRHEVFSRRGGTYFGIAMLLDYPATYPAALYRFADYNAGRYASRNAAFQAAVARLSGRPLDLDGDLLRYRDEQPQKSPSATETALVELRGLGISARDIRRDLEQEKAAGFAQTALWHKVFALADARAQKPLAREVLPQIRLSSPKIQRKLTTEWFARRVDGRYQTCLGRAAPR